MSSRADDWVKYGITDPVLLRDHTALRLLSFMADVATDEGRGAAKSKRTYAELMAVSEGTVYNKLRWLLANGWIALGDQRTVEYLPPNRRPTVYDLPHVARHNPYPSRAAAARARGRHGAPSDEPRGTATAAPQPGVQQGCNWGVTGVQPVAYKEQESLSTSSAARAAARNGAGRHRVEDEWPEPVSAAAFGRRLRTTWNDARHTQPRDPDPGVQDPQPVGELLREEGNP